MLKLRNECSALLLLAILACLLSCLGGSKEAIAQSSSSGVASNADQRMHQECLKAARKILGERAEIVKYGAFNDAGVQEAVTVLRREPQQDKGTGSITVSELVLLRHEATGWNVALSAFKQIKNEAGFIGIDYVEDSAPYYGYRVQFLDKRDDGKKAFALSFSNLLKDGKTDVEALPIEVAWDPSVRRYREFGMNSDPEGFKPEIKNPPHLKR